MSSDKLKIGVVGCGTVAKLGHLPWYYESPLAEIYAVADPHEPTLKKVQKKYKIEKAYTDPNDLLDNPAIDAVSICSPHWAHMDQAIRASENGKHIICEKPIGVTLDEVDKVVKSVEKSKIIFQTATQKRFDPGFQHIKESLEENKLGKAFHASVYWFHSVPDLESKWIRKGINFFNKLGIDLERKFGAWRLTDERGGGGDFMDHGPHYYDLFRWWFGDIKTITAHVTRVHKSRVHEDHGAALLTFKDNEVIAVFERSESIKGRPIGQELGRIHATKGSFYFDVPHEYKLKPLTLEKYTFKNMIRDKPSKIKIKYTKDPWESPYAREIRSFINQILGRSNEDVGFPEEWIPNIYDGRAALEAVLASYESSRTQQVIHLPLKSYTPIDWSQ